MRNFLTLLLFIASFQVTQAQFQFVSPKPGSTAVPLQHNIILREGSLLNPTSLDSSLFTIQGSTSGMHNFRMILCDDGKTINLNPLSFFDNNETITVSVSAGITTINNEVIAGYSFSFSTKHEWTPGQITDSDNADSLLQIQELEQWPCINDDIADTRKITGLFTLITDTHPSPGDIFFDSRPQLFPLPPNFSLNTIDNNGDSIFQRLYGGIPYDFQMGKNGYFDTYRGDLESFDVMDSNFHVIDTYSVANGFSGDPHELTMLANGYAFLTGLEDQPENDTSSVIIRGSVIQEFDPHHNLIFEWRSFDHVDVSEAQHVSPEYNIIDYVHTNSIEVDTDGNIITSHRHLDQVNKIDVNTGDFIWRLGGVKNEFTFVNDTAKFSYQHDCRRLANGDITLYDDGNFHVPSKSYAKEYRLDEVNKTATLVWSYSHPDVNGNVAFYSAMGDVQRLPNGNTFICWGWRTRSSLPSMSEIDSAGNIVWELKLSVSKDLANYRAHKYAWNPCARPSADSLKATQIDDHSAKLSWDPVANPSQQYEVQYRRQGDSLWIHNKVNPFGCYLVLSDLLPGSNYDWRVRSWCDTLAGTVSSFTNVKTFATLGQTPENGYFFGLYPNPTTGALTIDCSCHISHVRLFNLLGQEIKDVPFNTDANSQLIGFSVSNLFSGNYLVEVTSDEKREVRKIVVMQK